jgi:hypothetical protein
MFLGKLKDHKFHLIYHKLLYRYENNDVLPLNLLCIIVGI